MRGSSFFIVTILTVSIFHFTPLRVSAEADEVKSSEVNIETTSQASSFSPYTTATKLSINGENRQPLFVSNDNIIFISKNRKSHRDPQIYFKNLESKREKRITHQKGKIADTVYLPKTGRLLYASTTDEDKESPLVLKNYLERFPSSVKNDGFFQVEFPAQEIYESKLDGSTVKRLTQSSGYDGFPALIDSKKLLYFSRWKSGKLSLFGQSLSKNLAPWQVAKTSGHDLGLRLSPQEKLFVWNRFSPDFKSSQLLVSSTAFKNLRYLTLEPGVSWNPSWHPSGESIVYSARRKGSKGFDLYEVAVNKDCQRQITAIEGDESSPTVSPDGKKILFTATLSGQEQIHQVDYPEAPLSCQ